MGKIYEGIFINGVFDGIMEDIVDRHETLPEHILYLQPYSGRPIAELKKNPPSVELPKKIFLSTSSHLDKIIYVGQLVGWEDKQKMSVERKIEISKVIKEFQRSEKGGLYNAYNIEDLGANVLLVRRVKKLHSPVGVENLIKVSNNEPLSSARSRSGGYSYVNIKKGSENLFNVNYI